MHSFRREKACEQLFEELAPLFVLHHDEVEHFKVAPIAVNVRRYIELEEQNSLRIFTARLETGELVGYSFIFVTQPLHYQGSTQAAQDLLFIHPAHRGQKGALVAWGEAALAKEGVEVAYVSIKARHNVAPMLERMGYELVDLVYGKRLAQAEGSV